MNTLNRLVLAVLLLVAAAGSAHAQAIRNPRSGGSSVTTPPGGTLVDMCAGEDPCADNELLRYDLATECWRCTGIQSPDTGTAGENRIDNGTTDGSDTGFLAINGGGNAGAFVGVEPNRGGSIELLGNEYPTYGGMASMQAGVAANGNARVQIGDGGSRYLTIWGTNNTGTTEFAQFTGSDDLIRFAQVPSFVFDRDAVADGADLTLTFPDVAASRTIEFPSGAPTANYVVKTDGSGTWAYAEVGSLISGSTFSCSSIGDPAPIAAPTNTGGLLCITGVDGSGGANSVHTISDPSYVEADNDAGNAIDNDVAAHWWELACDGGGQSGDPTHDDAYSSCVMSFNAAEGGSALNPTGGPAITLTGADTEGATGIGTNYGNSVFITNSDLGGNSTLGGGATRGGGINIQNRHKYGALSIGTSPDEDLGSSSWFGVCLDRDTNAGTNCGALAAFTNTLADNITYNSVIGLVDYFNNDGGEWGQGASSGTNSPVYMASVADGAPQIIVEGAPDAEEIGIYFADPSADHALYVPDVGGTISIEGYRRELQAVAELGSAVLDEDYRDDGSIDLSAGLATEANGDDADGPWIEITTDGADESWGGYTEDAREFTYPSWLPDVTFRVKTGGGDFLTSSTCFWVGLSSDTDLTTSADPTANLAAFKIDATQGGAWNACTNDDTGSVTCTGLSSATADTAYTLRIRFVSTSSIEFYINGALATTRTTDLPKTTIATANALGAYAVVRASTAVVRTMKFGRMSATTK